ncbi:hypothetical protein F2Q68_00016145 [Brassica cretica]|uniref:Uncharacterized protein n=1 Tax=Brassica cretica TaxID=69181 RepID=A0A8S9HJK7_BRACR|nr:hypothetical protein F2Q68_00016145 [Brassica cretica]
MDHMTYKLYLGPMGTIGSGWGSCMKAESLVGLEKVSIDTPFSPSIDATTELSIDVPSSKLYRVGLACSLARVLVSPSIDTKGAPSIDTKGAPSIEVPSSPRPLSLAR